MENNMTDQEKTREELLKELQRTRQHISELEMREIDLTQSLGQEYAIPPESTPIFMYASKEKGFVCQPGVFGSPLPQRSAVFPGAPVDESDPDFSSLTSLVQSEDLPALESDLRAFLTGHKDTISRRFRMHIHGDTIGWVDFHFVPIRRDGNQILMEGVAWLRKVGLPLGTGPYVNQIIINIMDLFESLKEKDSPLAAVFQSRWKEVEDTSEMASDLSSLASAIATAETWRLQGTWDLSFVKDHAMRYVWVSKPFARLLGHSVRELQGRSDSDLYASVDEAEEIRIGQAVMNNGAEAHLRRTRIASGTPEVFQDTLWRFSPGGKSGTGWIIGVSKLVEPGAVAVTEPYASQAMSQAVKQALIAAQFDSKVVLTGETGSGKGDLADYIHKHSRRSTGPIIIKNCAAIPRDLFESELFGHEKGAFTGAIRQKKGLLELADGGTLLLDEIGKMPLDVQGKLLVFLDEKGFFRVGGLKTLRPDVRLLVASNIDLEKLVADGLFLQDLYYRLNVIPIKVPPLRERFDELPSLLPKLLDQVCEDLRLNERPNIGPPEIAEVKRHDWKGNIRELKNILERSLVFSGGKGLDLRTALSPYGSNIDDAREANRQDQVPKDEWQTLGCFPRKGQSLDDVLAQASREIGEEALRRTNGNKSEAARLLGISRNRLSRMVSTPDETGTP